MEKNVFLTFCFSTIPGLGQMYQEYMKRGVSLLSLTMLLIVLGIIFETGLFVIPIPVVMAYSFFDSFKLRNMFRRNEEMPKDEYIFKDLINIDKMANKRQPIIGGLLIFIGIYFLLNNVAIEVLSQNNMQKSVEILRTITRYMPTVLVSVIAMWFGTKLIISKGE